MKRWKRRRPLRVPPPVEAAAPVTWPRLRVRKDFGIRWTWRVTDPDGNTLAAETVRTHAEALAVGLAHLAVHTATWAIDELGAQLPPGWERITQ